jgi:cell division protein FtsQ
MALLVSGVLGTASWVLLGSKLLVVRHVEVSDTKLVPRDQVVAAARIRLGLPMARLDTGAVHTRVSGLREVESVRVRRHWPGTVRIEVRERVPLVAVERHGRFYQLDRFAMPVADTSARPDLPLLMTALPGPDDPATAAALEVLRQLPRSLARQVVAVEAASAESVALRVRGGSGDEVSVVWGSTERTAEKIRLLQALQRTAAGRAARTIDVSAPEVVSTQ